MAQQISTGQQLLDNIWIDTYCFVLSEVVKQRGISKKLNKDTKLSSRTIPFSHGFLLKII